MAKLPNICLLLLIQLACPVLVAAESESEADHARAAFERGIQLAEAGDWKHAAEAFESCIAAEDRPAVRYNLVLAYARLQRPADVARHAEAFLRFPAEPHREDARARVEEALRTARQALVRGALEPNRPDAPALTAAGAPSPSGVRQEFKPQELSFHAAPEQLLPETGHASMPPRHPSSSAALVSLTSGDAPLLASNRMRTAADTAPAPASPRWRTRLAWAFGAMGASLGTAAVATYIAALRTAEDVAARNPYEAGSGFLTGSDRYLSLTNAIMPLALSGGAVMAAAIPVGPKTARRGSAAWALSALTLATGALVAGITMVAKTPRYIDNTGLSEPTQEAGALLVSAAMPLFSYALTFGLQRRSDRRNHSVATRGTQGARQ